LRRGEKLGKVRGHAFANTRIECRTEEGSSLLVGKKGGNDLLGQEGRTSENERDVRLAGGGETAELSGIALSSSRVQKKETSRMNEGGKKEKQGKVRCPKVG